MRKILFSIYLFSIGVGLFAQKPKLVVGLVVDQMRQDYIYRYWERFGNDGFKKLIANGYSFENCNFDYVPTYTGPGHASIYTGTTPAIHGVIANNWFDKKKNLSVYCVDDDKYTTVGATSAGKSPHQMISSTITDQLRIASQFRSKVIGISLKDRGAVLPAGHSGTAYWYDSKSGNFVTSNYYMNDLPKWVQDFNAKKLALQYTSGMWNTLYPIATYTASFADDNNYEYTIGKIAKPVFPYNLDEIRQKMEFKLLNYLPGGNTILIDMGKDAILNEKLGQGTETDFLSLSFSATDYAGHAFGPQAVEIEDMYLRLDKDLADFMNFLDKTIGKDNWSLFISSDHGANEVVSYLTDHKIPAGLIEGEKVEQMVKSALFKQYGDSLLLNLSNEQLFLDLAKIESLKLNLCEVEHVAGLAALGYEGYIKYFTSCSFAQGIFPGFVLEQNLYKGWNAKRSGEVMLLTAPSWMESSKKGTTHGSSYSYDTRVPLIFYGNGIKKGKSINPVSITDIAPTLAHLMKVQYPNGCTGKALNIFRD